MTTVSAASASRTPAPVDDEAPAAYRRRLFNRLARKLSPHELAEIRADDVSTSPVVMDRFEAMLLEAAQAEGLTPSLDNLPDDGSMLMRTRTDEDTGFKSNNFYGKRSFIADLSRAGQRVLRVLNPKDGTVLFGPPFPRRE